MRASLSSDMRGRQRRRGRSGRSSSPRGGFTLVEMIAVAVIIAILASTVMFAVSNARSAGQIAATKAKIAILDSIISRHWQTYQTRRVPLASGADSATRLSVLRQLMRMEMPDRWTEVTEDTAFFTADANNYPALNLAYKSYRNNLPSTPSERFQNAECLYMIVMIGLAGRDNELKVLRESDVGDVDGDGAKEFLDAWGTPIRFLRWPVGFVDDPVHDDSASSSHRIGRLSDVMPPIINGSGGTCWPDTVEHHDPFDVMRVDAVAFRVYPLIYSAGPDKIFDVYSGVDDVNADTPFVDFSEDGGSTMQSAPSCTTYDPLAKESGGDWGANEHPRYSGRPKNLNSAIEGNQANDTLDHRDNIHNHIKSTE